MRSSPPRHAIASGQYTFSIPSASPASPPPPSILSGGSIRNCYAFRGVFSGAKLTGADLSGADLTGAAMEQVDFTSAKLRETRLKGATLRQAIFFKADMEGADLANADVWNASFDKALNLSGSVQEALVEPFVARDRR